MREEIIDSWERRWEMLTSRLIEFPFTGRGRRETERNSAVQRTSIQIIRPFIFFISLYVIKTPIRLYSVYSRFFNKSGHLASLAY